MYVRGFTVVKQRILAMILILNVMASVIFTGAITRSFADAYDSYSSLYWYEFIDEIKDYAANNTEMQILEGIEYDVEQRKEDSNFQIVIIECNGKFACVGLERTQGNGWYIRAWTNGQLIGGGTSENYQRQSFRLLFFFILDSYHDSFTNIFRGSQIIDFSSRNTPFDFVNGTAATCWPTKYEEITSNYKVYVLRTITAWDDPLGSNTRTANISFEEPTPVLDEIEFIKFHIGDDWYLSTVDQRYMRSMQKIDDEFDYFIADVTSEYDTVTRTNFFWRDLVGVYVPDDSIFENVISGISILALPINDFIELNVKSFSNFEYWHNAPVGTEGVRYDYQTGYSNQVIQIQLEPEEKDVSDNKAWEEFSNYTNNYNITQVIPQTLPDQIFNTSGAKLLPCTVQVPDAYYDADGIQSNPPINVFKWGFGSYYSQLMYNFDLFDVAIIPNNAASYHVRYFYDTSLSDPYVFLDTMDLKSLFASYDIVIIVPDDDGVLHTSHSPLAPAVAYTGSGSQGILYTTDPIFANPMMGFCIITTKAIQKQQLFNFNNGLQATYKLMSDYVESEDSWKASFLQWSSSIYWKIDTLNGSLGSILSKLGDIEGLLISIKNSLDSLSSESDPDNLQPWYLSLWNFITNFKPSDNDFTATLNQYDNNWDNIPELPAPSTIPLLPESTPVPVISGGA